MDFKNKFKFKLSPSFFKKHINLIIPGAILFAALIMMLPLLMVRGSVIKNVDSSVKDGNTVRKLVPATPSREQYMIEQSYQDMHEKDAVLLEELAKQSTQRDLISYKIFPEPIDTSPQLFKAYGGDYREAVRSLMRKLNALDAPTETEIRTEQGLMSGTRTTAVSGYGGSRVNFKKDSATKAAIEAICRKRAESIKAYSSTGAFRWYNYWKDFDFDGADSALLDCWYSQVSYWVYEDVVDTVTMINDRSENVLSSPVKRLVAISFDSSAEYPMSRKTGRFDDMAEYVYDAAAGLLGVIPWTGRICDDDIDVIHFSFRVIVNARSVPIFIKELCSEKTHEFKGFKGKDPVQQFKRNQITVLKYGQKAIDIEADEHKYYRYGDDAVVQLDLTCEYLFYRDGYESIQPERVKDFIGQSDRAKNQKDKKQQDWSNI